MIFPCSVNAETGDQPTQDVLSSQRCEAEEDSVVVLDSRYYSFTRRPILENHFAFLPLSWIFVKLGQKRQGKTEKRRGKDSIHILIFFCSNSIEANEESVLILDEETGDGVEIEILDR